MNIRLFLTVILLAVFGTNHPCFAQSFVKESKTKLPSFEVSAAISHVPIYDGDATVGKISSRGYMLKAGYRPKFAGKRLLVENYLFYVPKSGGYYNPVPQINSLGITGNYLLLDPAFRINPFVGIGLGLYKIDDLNEPACEVEQGCLDEGGPLFEDETMGTITFHSGLYLNILPSIAIRGDLQLFTVFGSEYENTGNTDMRLTYSGGLSLRF